jgi:glyoxylase-like metal-dependent hydrolase (beta-lactamase superfamily II)
MGSGRSGLMRMPVPAFLVEHPRGTLVFDAGLRSTAPLFDVELTPDALLGARLAAAGLDAAGVRLAAASHLHFDHCGGLVQLPNARLLVQRDEWDGR